MKILTTKWIFKSIIPKVIQKLVLTASALHQIFIFTRALAKAMVAPSRRKIKSRLLIKFQFLNHLRYIFFLLVCFNLSGNDAVSERKIVVTLESDNALIPLSISPFLREKTNFSPSYVSKLEKLFEFDFNNNGMTYVDKKSSYLIEATVKENKLYVKATGDDLFFGDVNLTGDFAVDSKALHHLSDDIHEKLFGFKGVASTKILFTRREKKEGKLVSAIWESDYDGNNARSVMPGDDYCVTPSYIPPRPGYTAGSYVYVSYKTGQPKIYAASLKENFGRQLMTLSGNQLMPSVSRKRNQLAFISDVTGNPDLFIQDFDPEKGLQGKPRHLYTVPHAVQGTPSFSPDGSKIAFVSNKSGTERIYILDIPPPGTALKDINPKLVSKFTKGNTAPCWSPDGSKIAYCAKMGNTHQIMIYDVLNGTERQLTEGTKSKENPIFSPNSLHVIYNTTGIEGSELYLVNLKRPVPVLLKLGQGEKRFPSWER